MLPLGPSRPIAALQFFGRYRGHNGHRDTLEPAGSVANDPKQTSDTLSSVSGAHRSYRGLGLSRL
jgi:hypothetical protein